MLICSSFESTNHFSLDVNTSSVSWFSCLLFSISQYVKSWQPWNPSKSFVITNGVLLSLLLYLHILNKATLFFSPSLSLCFMSFNINCDEQKENNWYIRPVFLSLFINSMPDNHDLIFNAHTELTLLWFNCALSISKVVLKNGVLWTMPQNWKALFPLLIFLQMILVTLNKKLLFCF